MVADAELETAVNERDLARDLDVIKVAVEDVEDAADERLQAAVEEAAAAALRMVDMF